MSKKKIVLIILGIACLLLMGAGYLLSCSSVEDLRPLPKPLLNQDPLKEVMIFGASGTVGDGILKALLFGNTNSVDCGTFHHFSEIQFSTFSPLLSVKSSTLFSSEEKEQPN